MSKRLKKSSQSVSTAAADGRKEQVMRMGDVEDLNPAAMKDMLMPSWEKTTMVWLMGFFVVHAIALYTFTNGFLLTRSAVEETATCHAPAETTADGQAASFRTTWHADVWQGLQDPSHDMIDMGKGDPQAAKDLRRSTPPVPQCWPPKRMSYDKVFWMIIDALRFDFTLEQGHLKATTAEKEHESEDGAAATSPAAPYQNKMPHITHLLRTSPASSLLLKCRSDPPTTTMQRLTGMNAGTLPTFIDAGANFASSEVHEDHLLRQWRTNRTATSPKDESMANTPAFKDVYFMGDETWTSLFTSYLLQNASRCFPYESFKLFDLHTVDNGIQQHLFPLIETEKGQDRGEPWDLIITHFLGTDHCGHKYGAEHQAMSEKLREMNRVMKRILRTLEADSPSPPEKKGRGTLFVLAGDHGMTNHGDHGGESDPEVEAALFYHSPHTAITLAYPYIPDNDARLRTHRDDPTDTATIRTWMMPFLEQDAAYWRTFYDKAYSRRQAALGFKPTAYTTHHGMDVEDDVTHLSQQVLFHGQSEDQKLANIPQGYPLLPQIDLVPTFALLTGVPIPFGNLGCIIPDLMYAVLPYNYLFDRYQRETPYTDSTTILPTPAQTNAWLYEARLLNLAFLLTAIRRNALQQYRYLVYYAKDVEASGSSAFGFTWNDLSPFFGLYDEAELFFSANFRDIPAAEGGGAASVTFQTLRDHFFRTQSRDPMRAPTDAARMEAVLADMERSFALYQRFLLQSLLHCQRMWAQFDPVSMTLGVALLVASCVTLGVLVWFAWRRRVYLWRVGASERKRLSWLAVMIPDLMHMLKWVVGVSISGVIVWSVPAWDEVFDLQDGMGKTDVGVIILVGAAVGILASFLSPILYLLQGGASKSVRLDKQNMQTSLGSGSVLVIPITLLLIHTIGFASNSFLIFEDRINRFLATSLIFTHLLFSCPTVSRTGATFREALNWRTFGIAIAMCCLIRASAFTGVCREEQYPYCHYFTNNNTRFSFDSMLSRAVLFTALYLLRTYFVHLANDQVLSTCMTYNDRTGDHGLWNLKGAAGFLFASFKLPPLENGPKSNSSSNNQQTYRPKRTSMGGLFFMGFLLFAMWSRNVLSNTLFTDTDDFHSVTNGTVTHNFDDETSRKADETTSGMREYFGYSYDSESFAWIMEVLVPQIVYVTVAGCVVSMIRHPLMLFSVSNSSNAKPSFLRTIDIACTTLLLATMCLVAVVQRPFGGWTILSLFFPQIYALRKSRLVPYLTMVREKETLPMTNSLGCAIIAIGTMFFHYQYFFTSGHQITFTAIQWESAFVGFRDMHYYIAMILVGLNHLGPTLISMVAIPFLILPSFRKTTKPGPNEGMIDAYSEENTALFFQRLDILALGSLFCHALPTLVSTLCVMILRRHLMVWKIFAPRFMFQALLMTFLPLFLSIIIVFPRHVFRAWSRNHAKSAS